MCPPEPSNNFSIPLSPEDSHRTRQLSERRIQANRRNALRSTGPKTAWGKRTVARNAIKHGLLAREVVITAGDGEESLEEFHALTERLLESYEPVGVVEESLVQTIAACWWRKARVIRAENGEIRERLDSLVWDRGLRNSDKCNLDMVLWGLTNFGDLYAAESQADEMSSRDRLSALQSIQSSLRGHHSGLEHLSTILKQAKSEIANEGCISGRTRRELFEAFSLWDHSFALASLSALPPEARMEGRPSQNVEDKQPDKKRCNWVAFIDSQLKRISLLEKHALKRERLGGDAEARSFSLPPPDATDKLLRYEVHLDRQLYRAMDQLERL